jgi:hypothetical protein
MNNKRSQLFGAWCGPGFMLALALGFVLVAGLFPPHSPSFSGAEVAEFYQANTLRIRLGLLLFLWATALYLPFAGVLTVQMARIEGRFPMWSCVQLAASAGNVITLTFPMAFWATAAFRPERAPELIQLLDDLAWIPFVSMTSPFLVIPICIAIVGFMDKDPQPLFPRWACYYNLFAVSLLLPGGLIIFFQSGPFAWNGLFGIWIPFIDWGIWFGVTSYLLIKGIQRQSASVPSAET